MEYLEWAGWGSKKVVHIEYKPYWLINPPDGLSA